MNFKLDQKKKDEARGGERKARNAKSLSCASFSFQFFFSFFVCLLLLLKIVNNFFYI